MAEDRHCGVEEERKHGNVVWITPRHIENRAKDRAGGALDQLPRDVGWMLFGVGFAGFVAPGIFGLPFMVAGGMILWPKATRRLQSLAGFEPDTKSAVAGMKQIGRFLDDLERRYPGTDKA